ncbi:MULTISPECIES: hypothetical protein [unclassified Marivivens]|jgi:hypothetical protein|uniref:hypothetical protein n=1 Tax=unclassified Marivivens TaxID=2622455 RepID=UPI0007FD2EC1|nr:MULTISPECIES: hypothetical protein [unclassified Marivivens]APO88042.1 hypothetical protein BSK21_14090 [Marivivens sp. JLT3646]MCL7404512.1 hypothetical protein [Marivivens geojensis]NBX09647.1 hypothetical protein [Marivivens sp.]OBR35036.1 hypothetical protein A9199_11470 [Donghicola sp. JL3646]
MAWKLILHSFNMIFGNLAEALKVSVGPILVGLLLIGLSFLGFGLNFEFLSEMEQGSSANTGAAFLFVLLAIIIMTVVFAWIAVAWHRFVLLEQYPGILPAFRGQPIGAYIGRTLVLSLLIALVVFALAFVIGLLTALTASMGLAIFLGVGLGFVVSYLWLRIGLVLPATALREPLKVSESMAATKPMAGTIFGVSAILAILNFLISLIIGQVYNFAGIIAFVLDVAANWVFIMVGISILTTLYGHLIEKRPLID